LQFELFFVKYNGSITVTLAKMQKCKLKNSNNTTLRKWNIRDASRASLTFFAIELTGCLGPEAQRLCTQLADLTGEGPEGRKRVNELLSIGFQTNRAMRMSFMMREVRRGRLGLGSRMVTGMD
jgi:hypothetical protein